ncbi:unnamed protein product [Cuscuta epithymum]|uniref:Flavin-containing monooxygenase n=1 Tax=Cuscuta epithymum TaxID=186058 RepID=A0AAV0DPS7_9ASTE|nr:unnamed protein product [Cuscuta epithymum]CAH9126678.1 unnamed protein product [Cuscuta epithymum]
MVMDATDVGDQCKRSAAAAGSSIWVAGAVIVGAGPSGLAVAACLKEKGVPSLVLERCNCIASLWQLRTYDRLRLHLPKHLCHLPFMPLPRSFPAYPSKRLFIRYLEAYAHRFHIRPLFRRTVVSAEYRGGLWRVKAQVGEAEGEEEYVCRWVVVATGENAEAVAPSIPGAEDFGGPMIHTSSYKSGTGFGGKKVLVVGCGNSGMEVCVDLCSHGAAPCLAVRGRVHVLPRQMLGKSTFEVGMWLLRWLPPRHADALLLGLSRLLLGDTSRLGLRRPKVGPLQLKQLSGRAPVLDVGALAKIKSGEIKVRPGIKRVARRHTVEFVDGEEERFDAIIFATGYRSNVSSWLKLPPPPGEEEINGVYAVGFSNRGLLGAAVDSKRIAHHIANSYALLGPRPPTSYPHHCRRI